ncbi:hypothetical protein [Spiroplasma citri]|uniref:Uncharacterized protein n=1 Tax=Spiroplasma citri TaxID=2133 RepID=A0AAJ4JYF1_SPICI|nr:hypothetical protein [Spiroplasma citri]APE74881.1 hypothetical protein SCITRI_00996 [Spiroplasma citri]QED24796.1 hypothetical protein FRX96_05075 [Spiroplasma citri]QIA67151.1 hypothetical protein GMI18_05535 [Spiroplasma citri]QIA69058.1 hypothetical protein GL298_05775 [Spiroplasma citri]QIA70924.1 hypothetical protein GL981_05830 [Spiroplasma citri]
MNITELIDAINSHIQTIKWEIDALNSKIRALKKELAELKQQILYKEDFYFQLYCINCEKVDECILSSCSEKTLRKNYVLKDNSKYDKLPSKNVKYEKVK